MVVHRERGMATIRLYSNSCLFIPSAKGENKCRCKTVSGNFI